MSVINTGGPAFPIPGLQNDEEFNGMSLRQYAAIKLRVPQSGDDWLDSMILEARRLDAAEKAMQAYFTDPNVGYGKDAIEAGTSTAYRIARTMFAARDKGGAA